MRLLAGDTYNRRTMHTRLLVSAAALALLLAACGSSTAPRAAGPVTTRAAAPVTTKAPILCPDGWRHPVSGTYIDGQACEPIPAAAPAHVSAAPAPATAAPTTQAPTTTAAPTTQAPTTTAAPTTTMAPPPPKPSLTLSQQNAIRSAQSYLEFSGFSRLGLIKQLSSEYGDQYSLADATFAVDSLNVDWNAQAVRSAQSYLAFTSFSRQGLIDQLSSEYGDQYTVEQATYAATQVGL